MIFFVLVYNSEENIKLNNLSFFIQLMQNKVYRELQPESGRLDVLMSLIYVISTKALVFAYGSERVWLIAFSC